MSYPQISLSLEEDDDFLFALSDTEKVEELVNVKPKHKNNQRSRARGTKRGGKKAAIKKDEGEVEVKEEVIAEKVMEEEKDEVNEEVIEEKVMEEEKVKVKEEEKEEEV